MLAEIAAVIDFCMTYSLWTVARIERSEIRGSFAVESRVSLRSTQATGSAPGPRQRIHPAVHALLGVGDVLFGEPVLGLDLVDRIDRAQEVALIPKRNGGIDAHAAFELGVGRRPLPVARGHALGRHEGLAAAAGDRVQNIGA